MPKVENEKIFVREIKSGYLATYNGVKGKAKTMFKAIERAKKNHSWEQENIDIIDALEYGGSSMTTYKCKECGKYQYSADTKSTDPCIYCGGECQNEGVAHEQNKNRVVR